MQKFNLISPERGFISHQSATTWEEALLVGNGRMGALAMSGTLEETLILCHERLFLPIHEPLPPPDTAAHLAEIRALLKQGQYQEAADFVVNLSHEEGYGEKRWTDPFFPACDLKLSVSPQGEVKNYARTLDFGTGVGAVGWADKRGDFLRHVFVSRPDNVVVVNQASASGALSCALNFAQHPADGKPWNASLNLERGIRDFEAVAEPGWLIYQSRYTLTGGGYICLARVLPTGGSSRIVDNQIAIADADSVLVLLRVLPLKYFGELDLPQVKRDMEAVPADYDTLLARHTAEHAPLFNRVRLDLGGGPDRALPAETLVERARAGDLSPAYWEKIFDAGRYAILSSCGELPPNLQGVWTGTWGAPWSGDYTLNGNAQAAIASLLSGNMAELMESYFGYMESLLPDARTNAQRLFGCRGTLVASRASSHGLNNHFDATWPMTFWTAGMGWAAQFYFDYWLYTGDRDFLARRAVPFLTEAALFYEDFVTEGDDGFLLFSPSYSPENNPGNNPSQACVNATMDIAVAKELLSHLIAACEELGTETEAVPRWHTLLAKMPPYQFSAEGAVKEWAAPDLDDNHAHRHCSHLYPLYNTLPPDIAADSGLVQGFQKAIDLRAAWRRQEPGGGEMAFGLVQLAQAASSLGDADTVSFVLDRLARYYYFSNLATAHNPGSVFNTDLSGGLPAILIKSLLNSQPGVIELLPALPAQMPAGWIGSLPCRGQVTVPELRWSPGSLDVSLESAKSQTVTLRLPQPIKAIEVTEGNPGLLSASNDVYSRAVNLVAGQRLSLNITLLTEYNREKEKDNAGAI